jgi:hypothetical protein
MFQSNLDLPLNTKKVYHNITEFLPKFGDFWVHRFRVMNFLFTTSELYAMILCVLVSSPDISLHLVQMATQNVTHLRINDSFCSRKSCGKLKPLVVVCVCNLPL